MSLYHNQPDSDGPLDIVIHRPGDPDWSQWVPPSLPSNTLPDGLLDLTGQVEKGQRCVSGFGGFADVWKGTYKTWVRGDAPDSEIEVRLVRVAIKELRVYANDSDFHKKVKRLKRELKVWSQLDHPNIVPLFGICYFNFGPLPAMICPWMAAGTLNDYLKHNFVHPLVRWQMIFEIMDGLAYLHDHEIVHGDLSGANVLLTGFGVCRLTDFGLSTAESDLMQSCFATSSNHGAVRWAAPETYSIDQDLGGIGLRKTKAGDVYSIGSLMLQIFTGKVPWEHIENTNLIIVALINAQTPPRPEDADISDGLWHVMQQCWKRRPKKRPTIHGVQRLTADQFLMDVANPHTAANTLRVDMAGDLLVPNTRDASVPQCGTFELLLRYVNAGKPMYTFNPVALPDDEGQSVVAINGSPAQAPEASHNSSSMSSPFQNISPPTSGSPFTYISSGGSSFGHLSSAGSVPARMTPVSSTGSPEYVVVGESSRPMLAIIPPVYDEPPEREPLGPVALSAMIPPTCGSAAPATSAKKNAWLMRLNNLLGSRNA